MIRIAYSSTTPTNGQVTAEAGKSRFPNLMFHLCAFGVPVNPQPVQLGAYQLYLNILFEKVKNRSKYPKTLVTLDFSSSLSGIAILS